jgi:hypothetical protein
MRWLYFFILQIIIVLIVGSFLKLHEDKANLIKTPPKELAQWYKPENKRQVWLHNMFSLRREMQAVKLYAEQKDHQHVQKWLTSLTQHYLKISEMVPSWESKLDTATLHSLQKNTEAKDYGAILQGLAHLQNSCNSCHQKFQTSAALIYRAPDFSTIKVNGQEDIAIHMSQLTQQVNQIKIAMVDKQKGNAINSLKSLKIGMTALGESCIHCHKKGDKPYPSHAMEKTMKSLSLHLKTGSLKQQGRALGTLAVQACAQCHSIHKLPYAAKKQLEREVSFSELLKH